jgi:hypothetical protein
MEPVETQSGAVERRSEPSLHGVSLSAYAGVQAGLAEGLELDRVLALDGVDPTVWPDAEEAWADRLIEDLENDGPLQEAYAERLAAAQDRHGRRVPPLDEDVKAWLDFVRFWAADPEPIGLLARLGLRPSDLIRLQRLWSRRMALDPALAQKAQGILQNEPGEMPSPRPEPTVLPGPTASPTTESKQERAVAATEGVESSLAAEDAAPPMFMSLQDQLDETMAVPWPPTKEPVQPGSASTAPSVPMLQEANSAPQQAAELPQGGWVPEPSTPALEPSSWVALGGQGRPDELLPPETAPPRRTSEPAAPVLPFVPAPALEPPSTSPMARIRPGPVLPFKEQPAPAMDVTLDAPAATPRRVIDSSLSATATLPSGIRAPDLPFIQQQEDEETVDLDASGEPAATPSAKARAALTLPQYAALCAELAVSPQLAEQTFQRYGLSTLRDRLTLDVAWQNQLRRNPAEYREWQRLYQYYHAYLSEQARRDQR